MLNANFKDILSTFNAAEVEYLVVGAYAMAAHGCPRATGDIDLWVRPTEENSQRVWRALQEFGAPLSKMAVEDFHAADVVYQIGLPPQRIDILTSVSGVDFADAWKNRIVSNLDGLSATVMNRQELVQNKLASGRRKDLLDVDLLNADEPSN